MEDELLADILAAERAIRMEIEAEERFSAERLAIVGQELEKRLAAEKEALQAALEQALAVCGQQAEEEAAALLVAAGAYAGKLESLGEVELDGLLARCLGQILPRAEDDRQNEQA